jgi:hypothetical protein
MVCYELLLTVLVPFAAPLDQTAATVRNTSSVHEPEANIVCPNSSEQGMCLAERFSGQDRSAGETSAKAINGRDGVVGAQEWNLERDQRGRWTQDSGWCGQGGCAAR